MKKITETMVRKMKFTRTYIEPVVQKLDPKVSAVAYTFDHSTGDEYVSIIRNNETQSVCVSADSFAQMVVDVITGVFLS